MPQTLRALVKTKREPKATKTRKEVHAKARRTDDVDVDAAKA